jgi:hypothetical protein
VTNETGVALTLARARVCLTRHERLPPTDALQLGLAERLEPVEVLAVIHRSCAIPEDR